ncbi:hypothetical protein [Streptomyces virginiae]|uniref:hypothetical protein n=1 Tax=Streptomyces TaxID=1883 RepID=UPI0036FFABA0|nr:hypothetical protein OG489_00155 [Streptomyces erythrochromogenes]WSR88335.1 hypothetical protein OG489_39805 [Streptomyces erythrochromogenes]
MNTPNPVVLAGQLDALGDSWIGTLGDWADNGLKVALTVVVVVTIARKVSLKAGIGALIAMVLALGIYNSRDSLASIFSDEIKNPAKSTGQTVVVVTPHADADGGTS